MREDQLWCSAEAKHGAFQVNQSVSFFFLLQFLYLADVLQWRAQTTPDHPLFLLLNSKVRCTLDHNWSLQSVKDCLDSKKIPAISLFQKCFGLFWWSRQKLLVSKQHNFSTSGILFHICYSTSGISVCILPSLKHCSNCISCWNTTFVILMGATILSLSLSTRVSRIQSWRIFLIKRSKTQVENPCKSLE